MNKEKLLTLIHSPYITEKATSVGSLNQVVFKVDLSASKSEIKKAVEDLFDVEVDSVTTSTQKYMYNFNRAFLCNFNPNIFPHACIASVPQK